MDHHEPELGVQCFSLSPPRRRHKINDIEKTATCMRALNVPLMHSASDPGCMEKDQKKLRHNSTGCHFDDSDIKPLRRNRGTKFGCEKRSCMDPIEKELPPLRESQSPVKERHVHRKLGQTAQYQSLRSWLTDETRDARIALLHEYRQSPGPGEYNFLKPQFGAAFCGGPPAVSRLQCFGSTESRSCMTEKKSPRIYQNSRLRPRTDNEVYKYFPNYSPKLCKGLAAIKNVKTSGLSIGVGTQESSFYRSSYPPLPPAPTPPSTTWQSDDWLAQCASNTFTTQFHTSTDECGLDVPQPIPLDRVTDTLLDDKDGGAHEVGGNNRNLVGGNNESGYIFYDDNHGNDEEHHRGLKTFDLSGSGYIMHG